MKTLDILLFLFLWGLFFFSVGMFIKSLREDRRKRNARQRWREK